MKLKKNILSGKNNFFFIHLFFLLFFLLIFSLNLKSEENLIALNKNKFVELKILDKVSSKTSKLKILIGKEEKFKNLLIKILMCKNSEFDDSPEITAYLQVKDINNNNNDEVFVFNDWTFSSSPSLKPFDHPVYDIWLIKCY